MNPGDLLWILLVPAFGLLASACYCAIVGYRALVRWLHRPPVLRVQRPPLRDCERSNIVEFRRGGAL